MVPGSSRVRRPGSWGRPGDVPVPGDYDGDGDWEPAVYRDGAWFIEGQATQYLGAAGDVPVPGDYDGDGITEIAVFRPSVGGWYVDGAATGVLRACPLMCRCRRTMTVTG